MHPRSHPLARKLSRKFIDLSIGLEKISQMFNKRDVNNRQTEKRYR